MEEGAQEGKSIYWPMKVIVWPGIPPHLKKELVSLLPAHFPFQNLPSLDTETCPHSTEETRGTGKASGSNRTGFEPQCDFRQIS